MKKSVRPYYRCSFNVCICAFLLLIGLMVLSSSAFALQSGDFTYTVSGGTITITKYTGTGGNVVIPSAIDGKPVVGIGNRAFLNCTGLISVTIPDSVMSIGMNAFLGCSGLTSIVVDANNAVYSSQDGVLYNKAKTVLIQYPGGKSGGFTIPDNITGIDSLAFAWCFGLTSVTIPDSVMSIGMNAFLGCSGLTSIVVDANNAVYSSQDGVLYNKDMTVLIQYPAGKSGEKAYVLDLQKPQMKLLRGLSYAVLADFLMMNNNNFSLLTQFDNPSGDFIIPDGVTIIEDYAFAFCTGLISVTIPDSVMSIGMNAFLGCSGLTSIVVDANNAVYSSQDGVLYNKAKTVLIQYPGGKSGGFTIPDSVTSIGDGAFGECPGLTSVTIPDSVTSIGYGAFAYCTGLTSVTIPDSVTSLGDAFTGCTGLTSVSIGNSVGDIILSTFEGCSGLTSVTIGNSVRGIGNYAFAFCTGLTSVTIPDSVTSIGLHAFAWCSGLTSVTIPNSVTFIGFAAFEGCSSLTSVTIPNSTTYIGAWTFANCSGLTSVTIPDSVKGISYNAFWGCSGLISVTIPNSVTFIDYAAFHGCTHLTTAYFNGNAPSMGEVVFNGCSSNFNVCYTAESTGFTTPTWYGYPAELCAEATTTTTTVPSGYAPTDRPYVEYQESKGNPIQSDSGGFFEFICVPPPTPWQYKAKVHIPGGYTGPGVCTLSFKFGYNEAGDVYPPDPAVSDGTILTITLDSTKINTDIPCWPDNQSGYSLVDVGATFFDCSGNPIGWPNYTIQGLNINKKCCIPTAITLSSFIAKSGNGKTTLNWATESEIENAGFNLYRSESANGQYTKINASLIPAKGTSTQGASYEFIDTDVQNRKTYYYKLEDIGLSGKSTMHGPVTAMPRWIYGVGK
jgi:hypothetical protein